LVAEVIRTGATNWTACRESGWRETKGAPGNEVATIVGHAAILPWRRDDVMGIAALRPSYGLSRSKSDLSDFGN
jgi:hypothetical protein